MWIDDIQFIHWPFERVSLDRCRWRISNSIHTCNINNVHSCYCTLSWWLIIWFRFYHFHIFLTEFVKCCDKWVYKKNYLFTCIRFTRVVSQLARSICNLPSLFNIMGSARLHNCMRPQHAQPSVLCLNIMSWPKLLRCYSSRIMHINQFTKLAVT